MFTDPMGLCLPVQLHRSPIFPADSGAGIPSTPARGLSDGTHVGCWSGDCSIGWRKPFGSLLSVGLSAVMLVGCGSTHNSGQSRPTDSTSASGQNMVHLLETLLPRGEFSAQQGQGLSDKTGPPPSVRLIFDQDGRAAKVTVVLNRVPVPVPTQLSDCPDTAYHPYSHCTPTLLSGGAGLVLDQSPQDEDKPSDADILSALLTYKDGKQVFVSEVGSSNETPAARNNSLPLTLKQLSGIATSTVWKPILAVMPAPPSAPRTGSIPRMSHEQITHIIKTLLPATLHPAQEGGSIGFGHVVVDDSRGESLVAVNVQRWKPDDPKMMGLFKNSDVAPDGTRISIRKGPSYNGGRGAVEWSVDTFRTDGLRVVVSAVNARAYKLPASRSEPALSIEQLKQIALDATWQQASR